MKKIFILIGIALTAMLVLAGCAEKGENTGNGSSSSSEANSSYSKEYLLSIKGKIAAHMEELGIVGVGIGENEVTVQMFDLSDEMMSKIEDIIGKEAMNACEFLQAYDYPHPLPPLTSQVE
ncbi:MAG TPA: hypothetical protein H9675_04295 [Firmicutes bacterium]|nr:hypothetical protein [Bacillota bacterium]